MSPLDISPDFVEIGKANAKLANVKVDFCQGNVADMPFGNEQFDLIVCTSAFKNFKDPLKSLHEMYRVLKPNGIAFIRDMNRNVSKAMLDGEVQKYNPSGFDVWFMKFAFRGLRKGAYTKDEFEKLITQTRFKSHEINEIGIGLFVYLHK